MNDGSSVKDLGERPTFGYWLTGQCPRESVSREGVSAAFLGHHVLTSLSHLGLRNCGQPGSWSSRVLIRQCNAFDDCPLWLVLD